MLKSNIPIEYKTLYGEVDIERKIKFIEWAFSVFSPKKNINDILNVGVGLGETTKQLSKKFFVIGIDNRKELLQLAKTAFNGIDFFEEDLKEFDLERGFDAVVSLSWNVNRLLAEDELWGLFNCFGKHLDKGGILIANILNYVNDGEIDLKIDKEKDFLKTKISKWKNNQEIAHNEILFLKKDKTVDFMASEETYRLLNKKQVKKMLKKNGFKKIRFFNGYSKKKFKKGNEFVVVAVKKKDEKR